MLGTKYSEVCLPFDRKIRLRCRKHNGKRFTSLPQNCHIRYGLNPKKGGICVAWVWNREGTEKLVNGKQHSVWFVPTGMKGLPQNVLLNFRLEFPKSDLTIYLPSGISEIFCQMVSTAGNTSSTAHTWDLSVNTFGKSRNKLLSRQSQHFQKPLIILLHLTRAKHCQITP